MSELNGPLRWRHNDDEQRWELATDDHPRGVVPPGYVTDEFLRAVALPTAAIKDLLERKYPGHPLPEEAFAGRRDTPERGDLTG